MMTSALWNESLQHFGTAALVNHLWQSTVFALTAWLLALTLRNNSAWTRYWIWMIASVKFLVPFSIFIAAGEWIRSAFATPIDKPAFAAVMEQIARPFPQAPYAGVAGAAMPPHSASLLAPILFAIWACGFLTVAFSWWRKWRHIQRAVRDAMPSALAAGVPVLSSSSLLEPGVFGILRPVLLMPEGILDRLSSAQLEAIVAHEMCHVRRRDNLTFAIHMAVETIFWFHPVVWWMGTRLVEERELACDESVLQSGNVAEVYAEGILNVCKFYVESPLTCVSGVSGADLKKRIVRIMTERAARKLDFSRKLLLGAAGLAAVTLPIVFGVAHAAQIRAQSQTVDSSASIPRFEVSTVKPTKSDENKFMFMFTPDGISMTGVPVQMILRQAFNVEDDRIIGAPGWVKSDRFDIQAKVDAEDAPKLEKLNTDQRQSMVRPLLEDRFHLKYHHETRELPVYVLMVAKGGSRLKESKPDDPAVDGGHGQHMLRMMGRGHFEAQGIPVGDLIDALSMHIGRTIMDKTGLTGNYDFTLQWTPDDAPAAMSGFGAGGPPGSGGAPSAGRRRALDLHRDSRATGVEARSAKRPG